MEKRYEDLSRRLDGIDVTLKELKDGIRLLLASSQNDNKTHEDDRKHITHKEDDHKSFDGANIGGQSPKKEAPPNTDIDMDPVEDKAVIKNPYDPDWIPSEELYPVVDKETRMKPYYIQMLENLKKSLKPPFSMADVTVFDAYPRPVAELPDSQSIMKRFEKFKQFEKVSDFSDHFYLNVSLDEQPSQVWEAKIKKDLKDLEEWMPENVYVRVYEGRTDLLRAVIIGPAATPYHDCLFFFDVQFPSNYPDVVPLVHYYSHGLSINPCLKIAGKVQFLEDGDVWMPKSSNVAHLLALLKKFFNAAPFNNNLKPLDFIIYGGHRAQFYNEIVFVKSAKTLLALMNKPPKGFEEFVIGHFHTVGNDFLSAVNAYAMGVKVGCFDKNVSSPLEGNNETLSPSFKTDLEGCYKALKAAFEKVQAYYPL